MASALRDPERTRAPQAPPSAGGHGTLRDRLRALPPRMRLVLALVVVVLTAAPVAMALARPATLTSQFVVAQVNPAQNGGRGLGARVRAAIFGGPTRLRIATLRDDPSPALAEFTLDNLTISPGPRPATVRVSVPGKTTAESEDLARVVARVLAARGSEDSRLRAASIDRLREIEVVLERRGLSGAHRGRLRAEARFIRTALSGIVPLRISDLPVAGPSTGVDRLIERVDANGAPRPHPLWAGVVGLALGVSLCALWIRLRVAGRP